MRSFCQIQWPHSLHPVDRWFTGALAGSGSPLSSVNLQVPQVRLGIRHGFTTAFPWDSLLFIHSVLFFDFEITLKLLHPLAIVGYKLKTHLSYLVLKHINQNDTYIGMDFSVDLSIWVQYSKIILLRDFLKPNLLCRWINNY